MRVSLSWIKRLLGREDLGLSDRELQAKVSIRVAEIESELEESGPKLDGVVVGKVLTCVQHPNADKLRCTTVDIGRGAPVPVVCGAPNVAVGQTVAVATVGTKLSMPGKDGTPAEITIKAAKLRGEPSEGMICAEDELGLGAGHDGILVLADHFTAGMPLKQALGLGDTVFVIENHALTHRPDLWGQLGWAREIAAVLGLDAPITPNVRWRDEGQHDGKAWSATIRDGACLTYCGAVVEGVANGPSPQWLRDHLDACGVRPLGILVDVTNYVMLELGEPMHAFDLRSLTSGAITVRGATAGEAFATLDGKRHELQAGDLLICDGERPVALAGIMGGENSLIRDDTTSVLLEGAIFAADRIRRTRKHVGFSTDSSTRFEKGLPVEMAPAAIHRAIELLAELCPGSRVTQRFHAGRVAAEPRTIPLVPSEVKRLTGLEVPESRQRQLLTTLGCRIEGDTVTVPWWRTKDLHGMHDLVEDVLRHHGYERLQPEVPRLPAAAPVVNTLRAAEHRVRDVLSAHGWDEASTYAFTSDAWAKALGWDEASLLRIANPLSQEQTCLRQSLLPTLIEALARNRKHATRVVLFEVGKRYGLGTGRGVTPEEEVVVSGICAAVGDEAPFYAARDAALAVLTGLGHPGLIAGRSTPHPECSPSRAVDLRVNGKIVGLAGEVPKALRVQANAPERVGWFSIDLERLVHAAGWGRPPIHRMPSRFQAVDREFTFVCPESLPWADLERAVAGAAGELHRRTELITVYRGKPYADGEKAVSVRLSLQSDERTLEEQELTGLQQRVVTAVEQRTPARIRREG